MNSPSSISPQTCDKPPLGGHLNRLAGETSPYLLQHAHNPVDWYPWGEEALERARKENKPIFLSIGYSACHWCHVMERESFEDPAVAELLNRHFIAVKVDREERPDLDEIYMTAVQMMTGRGGWPLSVWLTPDLKPFFGGTYFPPEDHFALPAFNKVLKRMAGLWSDQPADLAQNGEQMVRALRAGTAQESFHPGMPDVLLLSRGVTELEQEFDAEWGGFGDPPKFPPSGAIQLLLRRHLQSGEDTLMQMATLTLDRMARGGIYDQIGGGFHRYSVDTHWQVPHFEKMLYDNALLSKLYLEAWQATQRDLYRRVAAETLDYVLRDMTDDCGGFHSAEDADSQGEEGRFYLWQADEIKTVLGREDGTLFCRHYGVSDAGNLEGRNILSVRHDPATLLDHKGCSEKDLADRLLPLRQALLAERNRRVRPGKDDKVLAAWNGMMISAFARGRQVLGDQRYLRAARRAADFVLTEMVRDGMLLRSYRGIGGPGNRGTARLPGYLDDYAEMAAGLLDLYEATFELRWLQAADGLASRIVSDFWDHQDGGFHYTSADHKNLLLRTKPFYDGAVPSGNSTVAMLLLRLSKLLDKRDYWIKAERILHSAGKRMRAQPRGYLNLLCALDFYSYPTVEIAVAGRSDSDDTRRFLEIIHAAFLPNRILAMAGANKIDSEAMRRVVPLLRGKQMIGGKTTVYVCENYNCKQPISDTAALKTALDHLRQAS